MPGGRPKLYKNPEDLQKKIDEYFALAPRKRQIVVGKKPNQQVIEIPIFTITGLVLYCGFCSRQSFYDLEKHDEFSYTIKNARTRIEQEYEEQLHLGNTCAIFALKNFDWRDRKAGEEPAKPVERHFHFNSYNKTGERKTVGDFIRELNSELSA